MDDNELPKLIVGDFNFKKNAVNVITTYFSDLSLKQLIEEPTHKCGGTIDHLYVSNSISKNVIVKTLFTYYSDHVSFSIKIM